MKAYILLADGYTSIITNPGDDVRRFDRAIKSFDDHVKEIAEELGLKEWRTVTVPPMLAPKDAVAVIVKNWYYENTYILVGKAINTVSFTEPEPPPAYAGMTEAQRRYAEKKYDDIFNEGGEGYNPYRIPEIIPLVEPMD